jgi:tagatose 6-phosphate kinase
MDRGPRTLTVTLNLAQDLTYELDQLVVDAVNPVRRVAQRAGGKGINVARVLTLLGASVIATGFAGGRVGEAVRSGLDEAGLDHRFEPVSDETRRTVAIVDRETVTLLNEPGPTITPAEWQAFTDLFGSILPEVDAVALSGSLPRGAPSDAYARLVTSSKASGSYTAVDASGPALAAALRSRPDLVKVNLEEAHSVTERRGAPAEAAVRLRELGAETAVVSLGAAGIVGADASGIWHAEGPRLDRGNPTGAGDTTMAALVFERCRGSALPDALATACALASTTVASPLAGQADPSAARAIRPQVSVRRVGDEQPEEHP